MWGFFFVTFTPNRWGIDGWEHSVCKLYFCYLVKRKKWLLWIETHWNTPGAFLHAQTTNSFPLLNLYFTELFIFWRVRVMPLNFRNIGNNSCPSQGKIWNKCTKKSLNPLKITGHSTFIGNNYCEIKWIVLLVLPLSLFKTRFSAKSPGANGLIPRGGYCHIWAI